MYWWTVLIDCLVWFYTVSHVAVIGRCCLWCHFFLAPFEYSVSLQIESRWKPVIWFPLYDISFLKIFWETSGRKCTPSRFISLTVPITSSPCVRRILRSAWLSRGPTGWWRTCLWTSTPPFSRSVPQRHLGIRRLTSSSPSSWPLYVLFQPWWCLSFWRPRTETGGHKAWLCFPGLAPSALFLEEKSGTAVFCF